MPSHEPTRRDFVRVSALAAAAAAAPPVLSAAAAEKPVPHPLLTHALDFYDVSRGNPKPHTLSGEALVAARLTPETWRCEVVVDPYTSEVVREAATAARPLTLADGTALDLPALLELGKRHAVRYLKAMQCLNIAEPLGQGLWEGVPLREVLKLCGPLRHVRRIHYHGFHNHDPKQLFRSSLSYTEAMETAPGDLPAFLAYRLNGEPIPLERGGPVRLVVPWAHGFKSIKWLQQIALSNDYRINDTYAEQNNDPDSPLKTAAYIDPAPGSFPSGRPFYLGGQVMCGFSGLERVESWVHRLEPGAPPVAPDEATFASATWTPCELESPPPDWGAVLPSGVDPRSVLGFDKETGRPAQWPLRYSMVSWSALIPPLEPGRYEFRARAVDGNGFAQPEPRPILKSGKNGVEAHPFEIV